MPRKISNARWHCVRSPTLIEPKKDGKGTAYRCTNGAAFVLAKNTPLCRKYSSLPMPTRQKIQALPNLIPAMASN